MTSPIPDTPEIPETPAGAGSHLLTGVDHDLGQLEQMAADMAALVRSRLEALADAIETGTPAGAARAHDDDDPVDDAHRHIDEAVANAIIRYQPVARDLRRLLAVGESALHLERIGDAVVDTATELSSGVDLTGDTTARLAEMVRFTSTMTAEAMSALAAGRGEPAEEVEALDTQLDAMARQLARHCLELDDVEQALTADRIGRFIERAGDHAVDIAEMAWFLATGKRREFGSKP